jgi:hypothetical protein
MPTLFYYLGLRFFFYSNDHYPIHVHVSKDGAEATYSINPTTLIENNGLKQQDLRHAEAAIEENADVIAEAWNRYFNA